MIEIKLKKGFYRRNALEVAPELLGKILVHESSQGITKGKIVEVEAYLGSLDPAAHSYKNSRSPRTLIQYDEGGYAYIYLIYGMYYCMNIVTNKVNIPEVVLIRALEPIDGIELMKQRRGTDKIQNLSSGPGKLCQAMGINKTHYGMDLCKNTLYLEESKVDDNIVVETSKRINIDYAGEAKDYLWRYTIKDNPFVSVKNK